MIELKLDKSTGYLYFIDKESELATGNSGRVYYHRFIMSLYLGRNLKSSEQVHHKDENKLNNSIFNLEILSSSEHAKIHNPSTIGNGICLQCNKEFEKDKSHSKFCSHKCDSTYRVKNKELTKEILDELIPTMSWVALGKLFGYSDNGIKKRAKALGCTFTKRKYTIS